MLSLLCLTCGPVGWIWGCSPTEPHAVLLSAIRGAGQQCEAQNSAVKAQLLGWFSFAKKEEKARSFIAGWFISFKT